MVKLAGGEALQGAADAALSDVKHLPVESCASIHTPTHTMSAGVLLPAY